MTEQNEAERKAMDEAQVRFWKRLIGKLHEGISQLDGEAQEMMLRKHGEATAATALESFGRMSGRDPKTFDADDVVKLAEQTEKMYSKHYGKGQPSITRKGNIITWRGPAPCYDPKITTKMIEPYHAYCDQCNNYYFEGIFKAVHKGPVKVEGLKSVLRGDDECVARIELL